MRIKGQRRWLAALIIAICCGTAAFGWVAPLMVTAETGPVVPGFTVHEWGTFTSFSGSDGVPVQFRPLVETDLPEFVWRSPATAFSKGTQSALQRIETPVTYFYPPREMAVTAKVALPQGQLTEYFPLAKSPEALSSSKELQWSNIQLVPAQPHRAEQNLRNWISADGRTAELPDSAAFPHYDRARATDSALVVFTHDRPVGSIGETPKQEFEKFLFYRGLGNFALPVTVRSAARGIEIRNTGSSPLTGLFLVQVTKEGLSFAKLQDLSGSSSTHTTLPQSGSLDDLVQSMTTELVRAGLFQKEAAAMVSAWRDSWFAEPGTRLLYFLPTDDTDRILPLTVTPAPEKIVRVMVGRLEFLSIGQEQAIQNVIAELAAQRAQLPPALPAPLAQIPDQIRSLGRLAIPAVQRAANLSHFEAEKKTAQLVIEMLSIPKPAQLGLVN